jgi:hypothetical protein
VILFTQDDLPQASANISPCGRYRYSLTRTWDRLRRPACWVMLNPSAADAEQDDPTIRRCIGFSRKWGAGGIVVVNLFAYRATDPKQLFDIYYRRQFRRPDGSVGYHDGDPVGPENDAHIRRAVEQCRPVVAAWGAHGVMMLRDGQVKRLFASVGVPVMCLGTTKDGHPRHPLYVAGATEPVPFVYLTEEEKPCDGGSE